MHFKGGCIMEQLDAVLVTGIWLLVMLSDWLASSPDVNKHGVKQWSIDLLSAGQLAVLIKPTVLLLAFLIASWCWPQQSGALADLPFWAGFALVFMVDDLSHYWYHRAAHEWPKLWRWHRTHHTPQVYQASIAFRENWLWLWFMPGIWWGGFMIYFGLAPEVLLSTAIVGVHNVLIHNGSNVDKKLYKNYWLAKIMMVLEYFINTPALHRAHHGLGENGVPYGNYGQTLFIWDVLFGTATFVKDQRPEYYGTSNQDTMSRPWQEQLWWPLIQYKQTAKLAQAPVLPVAQIRQ
jgi:sterol desaturase/sphingolipid hydroxylase (fatty acid hydroxylase superfamily)